MKHILTLSGMLMALCLQASAQNNTWDSLSEWREQKASMLRPDAPVITIKEGDIYTQCFKPCDTDNNGIVTAAEAQAATTLILDKGGRSNIIENYNFLRFFPNLTTLSVGNTPVESINLRWQTKLERVNFTNAIFLKEVILAEGCNPEMVFAPNEEKPVIRHYSKQLPTDIDPNALVPDCKKSCPDHTVVTIKDGDIFSQCFKACDTDNNGIVTAAEAQAITTLLLNKGGRSNVIEDYGFLKYFPNLTTLAVGTTPAESIDLSLLKKLERVSFTEAIFLKEVILAEGCNPEMVFAPNEEKPVVKHK